MPNHGTTEEARHLTRLEHYHEKLLEHLDSAEEARETESRHAERAREYTDIIGNLLEVYGSKLRECELNLRQLQQGRERERPLALEQRPLAQEQQKDQQHRKRSRTPKNQAPWRQQQSPEREMFVLMSVGARSLEQALDRGS